ncbi:hypothetical protein [Agrococcus sp. SGAir0287]|uniref:hypothetical protein n=1 Tax=Agrococcus sp. SGAir0287 TaxID=2070347 RepID=UPI0010CCF218|nr:hypothetical protein [Agrococcus sp. SGAir0287]QCR20008.1 hypothetical protein C1N71_11650 [Agrococcus sp. SGAir0287]
MTTALHGPLQAASSELSTLVERAQAVTRRLLLAMLELDDDALAAPAARGATRRHVLARCVLESEGTARSLGLDVPHSSIEVLRHGALVEVVDAVTTSLGSALASLTSLPPGSGMHAAVGIAREHLATLQETLEDLAMPQSGAAQRDEETVAV